MTKKSDLSRAFSEDGARKTHIGGQALIEGVMMRGKYNWAVGVRAPDGSIYQEQHDLGVAAKPNSWTKKPLVRGCRALVESLIIGFKALEVAANHAYDFTEEEAEEAARKEAKKLAKENKRRAKRGEPPLNSEEFSWSRDFGRPSTMMDALGAQTSLEVVEAGEECAGSAENRADSAEGCACRAENRADSAEGCAGFVADAGKRASASAVEGGAASENEPTRTLLVEGAMNAELAQAKPAKAEEGKGLSGGAMAVSMVLGLALGIALFVAAPAIVTNLVVGEYDDHTLAWNIIDGILRVAIFVFYIWIIGRMEDIKRMFSYHGAEHKTIHCYEHGLPLTPENARSFPCLHVRCGTAFLIMVMLIAIIVYTAIPLKALIAAMGVPDGVLKLLLVIVVRIALMPVIAGISYEITVRWAGSRPDNPLVKVILWPGMQMQRLTTNEPDDDMLECAIAAMKQVLEREELESRKEEEKKAAAVSA